MTCSYKQILIAVALCAAVGGRAYAFPGSGANCAGCHSADATGDSAVSGSDSITDPGPGALPTYDVVAGETVTLAVSVTGIPEGPALANLRLDSVTAVNDGNNTLAYTIADLNGWTERTDYYTISAAVGNTYTIDLLVDAGTASDFYQAEFQLAGGPGFDGWNSTTPFYLNVTPVPEPSTYALLGIGGLLLGAHRRWRKKR